MPHTQKYSQAIIDTIRMPLLLLDRNLCVKIANTSYAERFNTTIKEIQGESFFEIESGHWDIPELKALVEAVLKGKQPFWDFEIESENSKMGYRVYSLNGRYLHVEGADEEMVLIGMDDITDHKMLEAQKDNFIGIVLHEIKNPLTSIKGFMQILQEHHKKLKDEKSSKLIEKVDMQLLCITNLMTSFVDVYRIQTQELSLNRRGFSVDDFVQETVDMFMFNKEGIKVVVKGKVKKNVCADRERIAQVLVNLTANAIKYSPPKAEVKIIVTEQGEYVVIGVKDLGPGIPKNQQERIFERFYRLKPKDDTNTPGLGLGLYISQEIIKQHFQKLRVKSTEGQGSTFYFTLPIYEPENKAKEKREQKKEVWVVDDDESILEMLRMLLKENNYIVKTISKGKDLVNLLNKKTPDIILLDIIMKDTNGMEIAKSIKDSHDLKHVPVILMSANANIKEMSEKCKADTFIVKPFDIDVLLSVVKATLSVN